MQKITIVFFIMLTTAFVAPAETTNTYAIINGKRVEFSSTLRAKIVQSSIDLLASCGFRDAQPKWGAAAQPQTITEIQKQSHLRLVFSSPLKVEIPTEKVTLQVREIIISLPLNTAGIWVRTDDGIQYLAMFDHAAAVKLQKLLDEAQTP